MATGNPVTVTTAWTLVYSSNASGDFNGAIQSVSGGQITCRIATSLPSASDGVYAAQKLLAGSGTTLVGNALFSFQNETKTLIAKDATTWKIIGG